VSTAHRLALENEKIRADMIDSGLFQQLALKYSVSSVPKIIINETHELIGAYPMEELLNVIERIQ
jgi:protein-disulfide isomerase